MAMIKLKTNKNSTGSGTASMLAQFQKDMGASVGDFGGALKELTRLPSGIFPLDLATGGGIPRGRATIIWGPESSGKCHAAGTKVLMFNGTFKVVENIKTGDTLMGVDSTPRIVQEAVKGHGKLYRITPVKGGVRDSFVVNEDHVLSLVGTHNEGGSKTGAIVNISVVDYLAKSQNWKIYHHLYRVPVEFPEKDLPLEPHWLGLWLGDGASKAPAITTIDTEIIDYLQDHADRHGWRLTLYTANDRCTSYATVGVKKGRIGPTGRPVVPRDWLERLSLLQNKHIPHIYKTASRNQRLELLAGLLDSDGEKGTGSSMCFCNTNLQLCEDVAFVGRSLGLYASITPRVTHCNGVPFPSWRVYLSGDFSDVPLLLEYKRAAPRRRSGSALTSRFSVDEEGYGDFFGFTLDGDHLYMLDSFIVNHNTNLILCFIANHQRLFPNLVCVFFDAEHSFDPVWAKAMGVDVSKLAVIHPTYAEQLVDMVEGFLAADDCGLVVVDSLAAIITFNETQSSAEKAVVGGASNPIGKLVRKTTLALGAAEGKGHKPTLIYVNQIRYKIGVMFGDPETMPGGNAPRFQAAMSLRLFGKNEKDTKVSADMPVLKSVSFVLRKWKVPILATNGTYDQIMVPHKGLKVGEVDDWGTLSEYLKQLGLLAKNPKSGWDILGKTYPTLQAFRDLIYADKKMGADIRKGVIDKMLQTGHMIGNTPDKQA